MDILSQLNKRSFIILILLSNIASGLKAQTWNLLWSDEFSGATINSSNWNFETGGGGWGNNELQNYTNRPENAIIRKDTLLIIARKESYNGSNYTSARMTTQGKQNFTYGKIEASIKIPIGQGIWPAFWMLGKNIPQVSWPSCGEIDIMEHVNSDNTLYGTIHWNNNGHAQYGGNTPFNTSKFHTYGIEWDSAAIRWYLDGTKYHEANILNSINNTGAFHQPFFFILNLAVGGIWPGNPDATTAFPDTMYVDYVRVYQKTYATAPLATITSSGMTAFCSGDSLILNANAGTGYTYQWKKGGVAIGGATGIKYASKTSGSYSVTVTSDGLSTTSSAITVTVNSIPAAPTVTATLNYCIGATASALTASGTSLKWYSVATGGTGNIFAPSPNTAVTGTTNYYVSQTINACESPRALITVTVNALPAAIITPATSTTFCSGGRVVLNANSGTGLSYQWNTNGVANGSATGLSYTTGTAGVYTVTVKNSSNCFATSTQTTVTVNAIPNSPGTGPVTYCQGATATALTANGTALTWYPFSTGGPGTSAAPKPSTITAGTTNYYVSQTINACESPRASIAVTINATPTASTVSSSVIYCQNASASALTATGSALKWYTLSTGGTGTSIAPTPSTTSAGTTNYYVSQTINACESPRINISVTVNALPTASIIPASSTTLCVGESVVLNANAGMGQTYQWSKNGTEIIGETATSHTAISSGIYVVAVTNTNNCSATSSAILVTVNMPPTIASAGTDQYITTTTTQLSANVPSSGIGEWSIIGGTGVFANANSNISSVSGLTNGANKMKWTISSGACPTSSDTVTINVGSAPNPQTIIGSSNVNTNAVGETYHVSANPTSTYHWTVPTGANITSANADSSQITVNFGTGGGNISVIEANPFGMTTNTLPVTISSTTGLPSTASKNFYEIYPNPFSEYSTIVVHNMNNEKVNISIIDVQGILIFNSSNYITNQEILLGNALSKGVYFVRISYASEIKIIKLVKM